MFDFFITPWLIRIIYWLLQLIIVVASLQIVTGGNANILGFDINGLEGGLLFLIASSLALRLITELLISGFKIVENTQYLKTEDNKLKKS